ncbi:diguanylate cyclase domain-containing protein [Psychromonas sp.]|uniref:sensor domain-containing diguanylate cyclase n=1 Tax=Psychromonas sp. TaxID=1884585 RepID=UPI003A9699E1
MHQVTDFTLFKEVMEILPTPVLIKDSHHRYIFINKAFEALFQVNRVDVLGQLDKEVFVDRQVAQCNGGDLRVLETGEIDEAYESVFDSNGDQREVITRKSRLTMASGDVYLVGTIYDITDVTVMNQQLIINQTKLKEQSEQLENMVNTDPLTGCNNRRALDIQLPTLFEQASFKGGLLAIDVDKFKLINDNYGHHVGDLGLQKMVKIIVETLSSEHQLIRMGGEEFLVACAGIEHKQLIDLAEQLRSSIEASKNQFAGHHVSFTVSIGVVHTDTFNKWNLDKLINAADKALYKAKALGRNCVYYKLP